MSSTLKVIILCCGLISLGTVVNLLVKRRINERNSIFWLAGALIILALSTMPEILNVLARLAGVEYPPTLLFFFSTLVLLFISLYHSIQISILQERLKELTQHVAISEFNHHPESSIKRQFHTERGEDKEKCRTQG